ncbi:MULTISPECIES: hypothetical protein [Streptomyces]|uniref:Uncharacterized protein n=1 Tax=Streptomyces canarius TaxID=285453 RepID=A0ABQ3DBH3_9ACTN|nr:hypothetical protein [Streptomyces canarius]GHA67942.1 hypothetical protein GCM10010345_84580 [Streptomyces canarius]
MDAGCPNLRVWPTADVLAILRFLAGDEVGFDVGLREVQGQERLDVFCGFRRRGSDTAEHSATQRWLLLLLLDKRQQVQRPSWLAQVPPAMWLWWDGH